MVVCFRETESLVASMLMSGMAPQPQEQQWCHWTFFLEKAVVNTEAEKLFVALLQYSLGVKQESTCDSSMVQLAAPSTLLSECCPLFRMLEAYTNAYREAVVTC